MTHSNLRVFEFPSVRELIVFMLYGILLTGTFALVYGTTNHQAALTTEVYRLYWDWEKSVPLVSSMILIYFSLNLLTASTLFFLRGREIHYLALTYAVSIFLAGSVFYFFPTTAGFERAGTATPWADWYSLLYSWDGPYNLFPSLHITLSSISVFCISKEVSTTVRRLLYVWLTLICAAVILTHQHHLIDVIGGLALGKMCVNTFFTPFQEKAV
jgi:membrane-associated phospholipid phosphatase